MRPVEISRVGMFYIIRPGIAAAGRRLDWKSETPLRVLPSVPAESYLGVFAMVGILGGVTVAHYLALQAPSIERSIAGQTS
jgi:hypothetical protein